MVDDRFALVDMQVSSKLDSSELEKVKRTPVQGSAPVAILDIPSDTQLAIPSQRSSLHVQRDAQFLAAISSNIDAQSKKELNELCGRCLFRTLQTAVKVYGLADRVYVSTGDIDAMWLRDSAVQLTTYLDYLTQRY